MGCGASVGKDKLAVPAPTKRQKSQGIVFEGTVKRLVDAGWLLEFVVLRESGVLEFYGDSRYEEFDEGVAVFNIEIIDTAPPPANSAAVRYSFRLKTIEGKEIFVSTNEKERDQWMSILETKMKNTKEFYEAIQKGDESKVTEMIESKVVSLQCRFRELWLPIHVAARAGHNHIIKYLISQGADVNEIDVAGRNTLHFAAESKKHETVKFLIENGAKFKNDFTGRNPFDYVSNEDTETAQLLSSAVPLREYVNPQMKLKMCFPEKWVEIPDPVNPLFVVKYVPPGVPKGEALPQELKIAVEDVSKYPNEVTLQQYLTNFKRSMQQVPNVEFEFLGENETVLASLPARSLTCVLHFPTDGNSMTLKVINYCILQDSRAYIISYSVDISEWNKGLVLAQRCIKTFELK